MPLKHLKMAYVCAAEVKCRIKGHHVYNYQYEIGEELVCYRERRNRFSENAIVIPKALGDSEFKKKKKKKAEEVIVGRIPESLSEVLSPLMDCSTIIRITAIIDAEHRRVPEGTWIPGEGIEIPCTYKIYSANINKRTIRRNIRAENVVNVSSVMYTYITDLHL